MRAFAAFYRKEALESWRTYRAVIMVVVFVAFGILSPLLAKLVPTLLNGMDMGGGAILQMPDATAFDAWSQFFKNISQMGMLVLIIVCCGITANEFSRGTLVNILTKGLPRHTVIAAKLAVAAAIWTISYAVSLGVAYAYIVYFWGIEPLPHADLAFASLWVFGLALIALLMLGGLLSGNLYGSLLLTAGVIIVLNLIGIAPGTKRYNPISLAGGTVNLLNGSSSPGDYIPALLITLGAFVALIAGSIVVFNRKPL